MQRRLTKLLRDFIASEKSAGVLLLFCTVFSLSLANSPLSSTYADLWHLNLFTEPVEFWINDGLMTVFFLLVGLEIERELYVGELARIRKSLLPVIAGVGGMVVPALIHYSLNNNTPTEKGFGIPMATDIAFSLGVLSLIGSRVPAVLKIFLTALAIIDDLGAIMVIAIFYSENISFTYLGVALSLFGLLLVMNRARVHTVSIYLILGCFMWYCMFRAGIHPTITGVLLAFAIPFGNGDENSPSYGLQHKLHKIVAFVILPLFALANTAIDIPVGFLGDLTSRNSYGIIGGLVVGKPLGIFLFSVLGSAIGLCSLPAGVKKRHVLFVGMLAGIGFTMSIFITLLAFKDPAVITSSKISIILGSLIAGIAGYLGLYFSCHPRLSSIGSR